MRFYFITGLFLLVGYVIYIAEKSQAHPVNSLIENIIDETMIGISAKRFCNGKLNQTMSMQSWSHEKGGSVFHFQSPVLTLINDNRLTWRITAQTGEGFQTSKGHFEKLFLSQDVTLLSFNDAEIPEWTLKTSELWYYPDLKKAHAKNLVTIQGPEMTLKSQGLDADLNKQNIEFSNRVKTVYEKYH